MRVGFVSHWFDPEGGAAAGPGTIAHALADRGHDVHVITGYPIYPAGRLFEGYRNRPYMKEKRGNLTVHRFPIYPSHDDRSLGRLANYVSFAASAGFGAPIRVPKMEAAFVYSTPATVGAVALALRLLRGTPYVVQIQDMWPQTVTASGMLSPSAAKLAGVLINPFCDAVYHRASSIAVTSPGMAELIAARAVTEDKIQFVPNWADEEAFRPEQRDPELAERLGLRRPTTVMYAGNLGKMQNLSVLLEAAEILKQDSEIEIAIVGSGVMEQWLRDEVSSKKLNNVRMIGSRPFSEMASMLALGDIQLISLKDEPIFRSTLPSKLQANLACGRPLIGAVRGDAAAVIRDSMAGYAIQPGDVKGLVDSIRDFARRSITDRVEMGRNARAYYELRFAKESTIENIERLLLRASGERRG